MLEVKGNLWTYPLPQDSVRVITTNGFVKRNGQAVMGRGCALEAAQRWPQLPEELGSLLRAFGNHVFFPLTCPTDIKLATFPVKHNWWEEADLALIRRSALELVHIPWRAEQRILLPRPGAGNGRLPWSDVYEVIADILDDRFLSISPA
jgi:hypothetical protein